ncbi:urease accessory UreF family protein [Nonomuraea sp. NPDC005650]|uniref:urease accessory protein UreF n=1 Tax=Nonomuraea sp. NPDC005650 TaxID=3157045 RepID=UPI0033B9F896
MNPALLLLTDSRLPAGGHAHSGGTERAITAGAVHDVPSLAHFLRGRLHTAGAVAATLTAAACTQAATSPTTSAPPALTTTPPATPATPSTPLTSPMAPRPAHNPSTTAGATSGTSTESTLDTAPSGTEGSAEPPSEPSAEPSSEPRAETPAGRRAEAGTAQEAPESPWVLLDAEADARTAAPAQRDASRTQGRLLLRVARRMWPSPVLEELARAVPSPHHPIALGAVAHAAGATAGEAAMAAAYHAISGPATAAVRLLGLDPVAVHGLLADLAPDLAAVASRAAADAGRSPWEALPAHSSPALDLLAEQHARAEVRMFVS